MFVVDALKSECEHEDYCLSGQESSFLRLARHALVLILRGLASIPVGLAMFLDDANVRAENVPTSVGNADVPVMYHADLCR